MSPHWKGPDGLVHITGTHSYMAVFTECGKTVVAGGSPGRSWPEYEDTVETPTCLACISGTLVSWSSWEALGEPIFNIEAIKKLDLKLTDD